MTLPKDKPQPALGAVPDVSSSCVPVPSLVEAAGMPCPQEHSLHGAARGGDHSSRCPVPYADVPPTPTGHSWVTKTGPLTRSGVAAGAQPAAPCHGGTQGLSGCWGHVSPCATPALCCSRTHRPWERLWGGPSFEGPWGRMWSSQSPKRYKGQGHGPCLSACLGRGTRGPGALAPRGDSRDTCGSNSVPAAGTGVRPQLMDAI